MKELESQIRSNIHNEYNSIPIGLPRFEKVYPGIMRGVHTAIVGVGSVGKTKLLTHLFIINVLDEVKKVNDPAKLDVKIFLYLLKTSKRVFKAKIISAFLKRDHNIDMDYLQLMSIGKKTNRTMTEEILDTKVKQYDEWFNYFNSKVTIYDTKKKPSEIFETTKKWLNENAGRVGNDDQGDKVFEYDNPNLFVVSMVDTVNSLQGEVDKLSGMAMDIKKCIEKHVISNMTELKTVYNCAIVDIHDLSLDADRVKSNFGNIDIAAKLEPSMDGLGESKIVSRNYDVILGIHDPARYEETEHKKYNIALLGQNYRSLKMVRNELGDSNLYLGLWFDGGAGTYEELPKSAFLSNPLNMERYLKSKGK